MTAGSIPDRDERIETTFATRTQCEICERERLCIERYGLVTCQPCHRTFLPSGLLF